MTDRKFILFLIVSMLVLVQICIRFHVNKVNASNNSPVHNLNTGLNYTSIQEGIDAEETLNGHTLFAESGTYGFVFIHKSISLVGEDVKTTIINGGYNRQAVVIEADNAVLENFTIKNAPSRYGIRLFRCSGVTIKDNYIIWVSRGIYLESSSRNTIQRNNLELNEYGIFLLNSPDNYLSENTLSNRLCNIYISNSPNNLLRNNHLTGEYIYNLAVLGDAEKQTAYMQDIDTSNKINNKPIYYLLHRNNLLISPSTYPNIGFLGLIKCSYITVENITLADNYQGILLVHTRNSDIICNLFKRNRFAIYSINSSNNFILSNDFIRNAQGIYLFYSSNNRIILNNFSDFGTALILFESSLNRIYHNIDFCCWQESDGLVNYWDNGYPSGGNYWIDYEWKYPNATELNDSGIWDTPYVIDENNQDNYPLIPEFSSLFFLPLLLLATSLATWVYKKKKKG